MHPSALREPFRRLAGRPDFRQNPVKALAKRVAWRLRWLCTSDPVELSMNGGFSIAAPKGAAGALIYYLGNSEPESARFLRRILKPGMVFFDIGAHIGEYTLIASRLVGSDGSVHAFEAQPSTFSLLERNCAQNGAGNVKLNACAVCDHAGEVEFDLCAEPAMSSLAADASLPEERLRRIRVPANSLDEYCQARSVWPDVLKIDVEGAEWMVLRGAEAALRRPTPPAILFECLPETYSRFGHSPGVVIGHLQSLGYEVHRIGEGGALEPFEGVPGIGYNLVALHQ